VPACDGPTDGQTDRQWHTTTAYTVLAWRRAIIKSIKATAGLQAAGCNSAHYIENLYFTMKIW